MKGNPYLEYSSLPFTTGEYWLMSQMKDWGEKFIFQYQMDFIRRVDYLGT